MTAKHRTLFITDRGAQQQAWALESAPPELDILVRRAPGRDELLALLPEVEFLISERSGTIDAEMIAVGRRLRLIQRLGTQTWDIDVAAARRAASASATSPYRPASGWLSTSSCKCSAS